MRYPFILPLVAVAIVGSTLPGSTQPASTQKPVIAPLNKSRSYIGLKYRDVPQGVDYIGGWVIDLQKNGDFKHAVTHVRDHNGEMLWLDRFINHDRATGKANFQVVDVLKLPLISKAQVFSAHGFCMKNGNRDPDLIAIAKATDTQYRTTIYRAWKANRAKETFEEISTKGITCENPAWGV
ncbi:hypothetical protein [Myxacorys almedinensis]|uniref:Uncharacterized protein n=1 Tax=Myxacorys almedinensis A TaxID=2690445 RepID=A0A8J7Z4F1_9CYAN|nr:hypothetical protein [Myxacorys almedinensis]NDJ17971.1 hypothetical protein [Myxacorys almedinensis A]